MDPTTSASACTQAPSVSQPQAASSGRVHVGDYVGQLAAEATQAVRRAGLRPGLDRCQGYEPAQIGHVIAQDPDAGSEVPRNSIITLHVAAPAPSAAHEPAETGHAGHDAPAPEVDTPSTSMSELSTFHSQPRGEQAAYPRLEDSRDEQQASSSHPATSGAGVEDQPTAIFDLRGDTSEQQRDQPVDEQLLAHADELFAAHAGEHPVWPGDYRSLAGLRAAGQLRRARGWFSRRSRPAKVASVLVGVWVAIWLLAILVEHHPVSPRPRTGQARPLPSHVFVHAAPRPASRRHAHAPVGHPSIPRTVTEPTQTPSVPAVASPANTVDHSTEAQAPAPPSTSTASTPTTAGPAPQNSPNSEPQQQTKGGPFSP